MKTLDLSKPWEPSPAYRQRMAEAARLKVVAQQLDAPPQYRTIGTGRFQRAHWIGHQWAVTSYGIECREHHPYAIEASRLWEAEDAHGWVQHMAEKNWVDLPDFAEALRIARRYHKRKAGGGGRN